MIKDMIIIGGGPAGNAAALAAAEVGGGSILLIEREAFGGTCTNRGCIPTKFFLSRSAILGGRGDRSTTAAGEWAKLLSHKNALVKGLSRSIESRCEAQGVEIVKGWANFTSPHDVSVRSSDGAISHFQGKTMIIATGSLPAQLASAPCDGERIITSTEALDLKELPLSLAIIGSGPVGAEFAFIFTRLGVKVAMIEAASRLFPAEDQDVDSVFRIIYKNMGISVYTGDPVVGIEKRDSGVAVLLESGAVIEAAKALVGIGRALSSPELDCQSAGVRLGDRGEILVDEELRTSQRHIFAAGDVTGKMLLAHAASYMGEYAAKCALGESFGKVPFPSIPWATFTVPEVAAVGLNLESAVRSGLSCAAATVPLMDNVKARIDRTTDGFVKIVAERGTGKIVGGTIVGPHASDLIHIVALAVHKGMSVQEMRGFSFLHPSISESIADLCASFKYINNNE